MVDKCVVCRMKLPAGRRFVGMCRGCERAAPKADPAVALWNRLEAKRRLTL